MWNKKNFELGKNFWKMLKYFNNFEHPDIWSNLKENCLISFRHSNNKRTYGTRKNKKRLMICPEIEIVLFSLFTFTLYLVVGLKLGRKHFQVPFFTASLVPLNNLKHPRKKKEKRSYQERKFYSFRNKFS